jgi:hypothetical protein
MFSRKADGSLTVQIPAPGEDRASWTRVGVITAIGFIAGVAWPRLMGVRLGPSVPESATAASGAAGPSSDQASSATAWPTSPAAPSVPVAPAAAAVPAPATSVAAATANVTVGHGVIFACKTSEGDSLKGGDCGSLPGLDSVVMTRLHKLAECPEAASSTGKLHLVVHVDFPRSGLGVDLGRGHGVSAPDALLACAKAALGGASLGGITHDNPHYNVAYAVTFAPGEGATGAAPASAPAADRLAAESAEATTVQVVWEVAIVRDAPKTGKVVARLQHGSELHLGAPKDGWYPVKFGDGFASDGWFYRGAIGR